MHAPLTHIQQVNLRAASERDYDAFAAFSNRLRAERQPEDPPMPREEQVSRWQNAPTHADMLDWAIWSDDQQQIIARCNMWIPHTDNQHIADFSIEVLPEYRRRGLATRLLPIVVETARRANRRLLLTATHGRAPAGRAFMEHMGADAGLEMRVSQLRIDELNRELVREWQARAAERAAEYAIGVWEGPYPEDQLARIADLFHVMNTAPRGSLDVEDEVVTPEILREWEKGIVAAGTVRWTVYAYERSSGAFAGFTEVFWNPNRSAILGQGATGVFPQYRNLGLGRWIKAAMLDKVLRDLPEVKVIRTGNAETNAAMLGINIALGFKPYSSECVWQIETNKAAAYLEQLAVTSAR